MTSALEVEELADRVVVHLARPEVRNAIDHQMVSELHAVCDLLENRPRVLLLAGKGGNFAAGADISQLLERRRDDALRGINSALFDRIHRLPMPVVGLLDGYALGGGAELAYACDFRIGTPRVRIGNPEPGLGILAGTAAWRDSDLWLHTLRNRLDVLREDLADLLATHLPQARMRPLEATYLAWLDLRAYDVADPAAAGLEHGVMAAAGHDYHPGLEGHLRLNIATSADRLAQIVRRLGAALT